MKCGKILRLLQIACIGLVTLMPASAHAAQNARINNLSDVDFGSIANFSIDQTSSQSVCVYSTFPSSLYHITATGSGSGGAFTLSSGSDTMAYEVQWANTSDRKSVV